MLRVHRYPSFAHTGSNALAQAMQTFNGTIAQRTLPRTHEALFKNDTYHLSREQIGRRRACCQ